MRTRRVSDDAAIAQNPAPANSLRKSLLILAAMPASRFRALTRLSNAVILGRDNRSAMIIESSLRQGWCAAPVSLTWSPGTEALRVAQFVLLFQSYSSINDIAITNIRNTDLNLLAVFDALLDERSVTRAARRLSLTQPTVSGMLQRLRRAFADELFVRTSHGILPTPRAEALAGPIKELLADAQRLMTAQAFSPANAEGLIKI